MRRLPAAALIAVALWAGCSKGASSSASPEVSSYAAYAAKASRIVDEVVAGEFSKVRAEFDERMKAGLSEAKLREGWAQFQSIFGAYEGKGEPDVLERGDVTVVNVPLDMKLKPGEARITFDANGRIAGLFFLRTGVPVP